MRMSSRKLTALAVALAFAAPAGMGGRDARSRNVRQAPWPPRA
jgi:hypothetical protein